MISKPDFLNNNIKYAPKANLLSPILDFTIVFGLSKISPIKAQPQLGQDATVNEGSFKGMIVKICSLPSEERVGVLLTFLGTSRRVIIPTKNLIF